MQCNGKTRVVSINIGAGEVVKGVLDICQRLWFGGESSEDVLNVLWNGSAEESSKIKNEGGRKRKGVLTICYHLWFSGGNSEDMLNVLQNGSCEESLEIRNQLDVYWVI